MTTSELREVLLGTHDRDLIKLVVPNAGFVDRADVEDALKYLSAMSVMVECGYHEINALEKLAIAVLVASALRDAPRDQLTSSTKHDENVRA